MYERAVTMPNDIECSTGIQISHFRGVYQGGRGVVRPVTDLNRS